MAYDNYDAQGISIPELDMFGNATEILKIIPATANLANVVFMLEY